MLWRCSEIDGYEVVAQDGKIGTIEDLLFDEGRWTARWVVVDTGGWLVDRAVLLAPSAFGHPDRTARRVSVALTKKQVEESPPVSADLPISRRTEIDLSHYYGWAPYWEADLMPPFSYLAGGTGSGFLFPPDAAAAGNKPGTSAQAAEGDPLLHSVADTRGLTVHASDGDLGHVEDFLLDEEGWRIRYMIVNTGIWILGRKVLVSPNWIEDVNWPDRRVHVDLTRQKIKESPIYRPGEAVERSYEETLHGHYGKEGYWPPVG